jgi:hypothetical protein
MDLYKNVSSVEFGDIYAWFCFRQGYIPGYETRYFDTASVHVCHIEGHSVVFYSDNSGDRHYVYTGFAWSEDKHAFRSLLVGTSPLETIRKKFEYVSDDAIETFNRNLQEFLDYIHSYPESDSRDFTQSTAEDIEEFHRLTFEPYPLHYPTLYVINDSFSSASICRKFKEGFDQLSEREKVVGNDRRFRLVSLTANKDNLVIHPLAHEGFTWAWFKEEDLKVQIDILKKPNGYWDRIILAVRPHYVHEIFVADLSIADDYRDRCIEKSDSYLTDKEYNKYITLRGVNVVTFKDFMEKKAPTIKKPQILIKCNFGYDEVTEIYFRVDNQQVDTLHK